MIKFNEIDLGYVWNIERVLSKVTEWKRLDSNNHIEVGLSKRILWLIPNMLFLFKDLHPNSYGLEVRDVID